MGNMLIWHGGTDKGVSLFRVTSLPSENIKPEALYLFNGVVYQYNAVSESWEEVMSGGSGSGSGSLSSAMTATKTVGGVDDGTVFESGTELEEIIRRILSPTLYPVFTAPSAAITAPGTRLLENGSTFNTTITVAFNRGSISPAYGTSGYRSGEAVAYSLNGDSEQTANSFAVTVSGANKSFYCTVSYDAGEQPKDSSGKDYSTPLASGRVNSNTLNYEFVNAMWSNASNISVVSKDALVSRSAKQKQWTFPPQTATNPGIFDVPADYNVTAVEILNTLSGKWEAINSEYSITDITHDDASGVPVGYKRYTNNLGYEVGTRDIRIKWN